MRPPPGRRHGGGRSAEQPRQGCRPAGRARPSPPPRRPRRLRCSNRLRRDHPDRRRRRGRRAPGPCRPRIRHPLLGLSRPVGPYRQGSRCCRAPDQGTGGRRHLPRLPRPARPPGSRHHPCAPGCVRGGRRPPSPGPGGAGRDVRPHRCPVAARGHPQPRRGVRSRPRSPLGGCRPGPAQGVLTLAAHLAETALEVDAQEVQHLTPPRPHQDDGLPRVAAIVNLQTQGTFKDVFVYGRSYAGNLPTLLDPAELDDGAVVSGQFGHPSLKNPTFLHQNNPVVAALRARDGVDLRLAGVVICAEPVDQDSKAAMAAHTARLCALAGFDAAVITKEGGGNADADVALKMDALEEQGIDAVGLFAEMPGPDGTGPSIVVPPTRATAMVSTGNYDDRLVLPAVERPRRCHLRPSRPSRHRRAGAAHGRGLRRPQPPGLGSAALRGRGVRAPQVLSGGVPFPTSLFGRRGPTPPATRSAAESRDGSCQAGSPSPPLFGRRSPTPPATRSAAESGEPACRPYSNHDTRGALPQPVLRRPGRRRCRVRPSTAPGRRRRARSPAGAAPRGRLRDRGHRPLRGRRRQRADRGHRGDPDPGRPGRARPAGDRPRLHERPLRAGLCPPGPGRRRRRRPRGGGHAPRQPRGRRSGVGAGGGQWPGGPGDGPVTRAPGCRGPPGRRGSPGDCGRRAHRRRPARGQDRRPLGRSAGRRPGADPPRW